MDYIILLTTVLTFFAPPIKVRADASVVLPVIAQCESGGKFYYPDGSIVKDSVTGTHVGLYQISEGWDPLAKQMGFYNVDTPIGNTQMAAFLYSKYGTAPWKASQECWSKRLGTDTS